MSLSSVRSILLSTALAITSVQASPFDLSATLQARDLLGSSCVPFVYGAKNTPGGEVCTSISGNNLIVNYPDLSGGSYSDLHVIVQTGAVTEPNQGKWPYTLGKGQCTTSAGTASCTIPILDAWRKCSAPLYVGVHASFNTGAGASETGWGNGQCISDRSNCPKYFTFTPKCECTTVTSYEPYSTSLEYVVTKTTVVYETYTTTCTTEKSPVTVTATCTNPSSAAVQTMTEKLDVANFACTAPAA